MIAGMKDDKIRSLLQASKSAGSLRVGFLLIPNFSMLAFASAIEPLRAANRMAGQELYTWVISSPTGRPTEASNGVVVTADGDPELLQTCRLVFACSGLDIKKYCTKGTLNVIRKLDRNGGIIGAICTGTYLMAAAGLLDEKRCTIHWENIDGLAEEFPLLEITNELFEIDDTRITCSGGTASLDMILYLISQVHGNTLAAEV